MQHSHNVDTQHTTHTRKCNNTMSACTHARALRGEELIGVSLELIGVVVRRLLPELPGVARGVPRRGVLLVGVRLAGVLLAGVRLLGVRLALRGVLRLELGERVRLDLGVRVFPLEEAELFAGEGMAD